MRYIFAILMQGLGPIALLASSVFISRQWGAEEQGVYALYKSLFDVLIVVSCFGFPQSFVLAINRMGASPSVLYRWSVLYCLILYVPLAFFLSLRPGFDGVDAGLFAAGVIFIVQVMLLRALILTVDDGLLFHVYTLLPTLVLSLCVMLSMAFYDSFTVSMPVVVFSSGALALSISLLLFPREVLRYSAGASPSPKALLRDGFDVFLQAGLGMSQIYLCLWWLETNASLELVGYFSVSLLIVNMFGFPLQALSPILLNRWSRAGGAVRGGEKGVIFLSLILSIIALTISYGSTTLIPLLFGTDLANASGVLEILIFVIPCMFLLRIGNLRLASIGVLRYNSFAAIIKLGCFIGAVFTLDVIGGGGVAQNVSLGWIAAEIIAMLYIQQKVLKVRNNNLTNS